MAVTYIPGPFDNPQVLAAMAQIGQALGDKFTNRREERFLSELSDDPQQAEAVRAALLRTLGPVAPEVLTDEDVRKNLKSPFPFKTAAGVQQALALGEPRTFQGKVNQELVNDPAAIQGEVRRVRAGQGRDVAVAGAETAEAGNRVTTAQARADLGTPQAAALWESQDFRNKMAKAGIEGDALGRYREYIAALPAEEQMHATMALANPQFLADLQFHENLELQESLASIRARQGGELSPGDLLGVMFKLNDEEREIRKAIKAAREGETLDGELETLAARWNQVQQIRNQVFGGGGATMQGDPGWVGTEAESLGLTDPGTQRMQNFNRAVETFMAGELSIEDMLTRGVPPGEIQRVVQEAEQRQEKGFLGSAMERLQGLGASEAQAQPAGGGTPRPVTAPTTSSRTELRQGARTSNAGRESPTVASVVVPKIQEAATRAMTPTQATPRAGGARAQAARGARTQGQAIANKRRQDVLSKTIQSLDRKVVGLESALAATESDVAKTELRRLLTQAYDELEQAKAELDGTEGS